MSHDYNLRSSSSRQKATKSTLEDSLMVRRKGRWARSRPSESLNDCAGDDGPEGVSQFTRIKPRKALRDSTSSSDDSYDGCNGDGSLTEQEPPTYVPNGHFPPSKLLFDDEEEEKKDCCQTVLVVFLSSVVSVVALLGLAHIDLKVLSSFSWLKRCLTATVRPLAAGFVAAAVTGALVYWDSRIPGEWPPSPLSSSQSRASPRRSRCHLAYLMAFLNGLAAAAYFAF